MPIKLPAEARREYARRLESICDELEAIAVA